MSVVKRRNRAGRIGTLIAELSADYAPGTVGAMLRHARLSGVLRQFGNFDGFARGMDRRWHQWRRYVAKCERTVREAAHRKGVG